MKKLILLFLPVIWAVFSACTSNDVSGTGHDGEAIVSGCILDANGKGITDLKVELLPSDFNPAIDGLKRDAEAQASITDKNGNYT